MSKVNTPETITQIEKQLCQLPPPKASTWPTRPQHVSSPSKTNHSSEGQILVQNKEQFLNHQG